MKAVARIMAPITYMRWWWRGPAHPSGGASSPTATSWRWRRLEAAAEVMNRHDVWHLIVVDPSRHEPIGVISALDIADTVAWGPRVTTRS